MIPALSQVCSLDSPFERDVEDYAAGKCRCIEVWLTKLENYLERHTAEDVRRLLTKHDMRAPVASLQGGIFAHHEDARRAAWELFERRLQLCHSVGIECLVIAGDMMAPWEIADLESARESLQRAAELAANRGLRLALEFQSRAAFANNLQTAMALVADIGHPCLGICLDLFHYYTGPSKTEDWALLSRENLFHVQICDVADTPRELATDADRILPGDGDFHMSPLVERLREIRYDGTVSVELMNPQLWSIPPHQFGEIAITALRKTLGLAGGNDS